MFEMIKTLFTAILCLASVSALRPIHADLITGRILCDANQNLAADAGDAGVAGALIVIVSEAGGFSNAVITAANGSFSLAIPPFDASAYRRDPLSQSYIETVAPGTLPADAAVIFPQPALGTTPAYYIAPATTNSPLTFISAAGQSTNGDWLISSAACQTLVPSNTCRASGSGRIDSSPHHVEHAFSGSISPNTNKHGFRQGNWTHVARALKLRFKSTAIDEVSCAETSDGTSAVNAIEFSGRGILRDSHAKKVVSTPVFFTASVEDRGKRGAGNDRYYIHVYDADGATLILISGDASNPQNIVPVPISQGNFRVKPAHF